MGGGNMTDDSAEILSQSLLQETLVSSTGMARNVHSVLSSNQHFLSRPRRRPPSGFGEPVGACDMPEPCKLPSIDSCQKKFLWTQKDVDLALQPVLDLVLQVGEAKKFSQTLSLENLDFFFLSFFLFLVSKQGPCFTATEEDGGDKRLAQHELSCEADVLHRQILFSLAIAVVGRGNAG